MLASVQAAVLRAPSHVWHQLIGVNSSRGYRALPTVPMITDPTGRTSRVLRLPFLIVLVSVSVCLSGAPATAAATCDRFASPAGSDSSGNGSQTSPYQSVTKLDGSLSPGQTGCLRTGTYGDTGTQHRIGTSGTASAQTTITSYPGEQAKVIGWIDMSASYSTLSHLSIDGSNTFYNTPRSGNTTRECQIVRVAA